MTTTEAALKAAISRLGQHKHGRRYPPRLREQLVEFTRRRVSEGASVAEICRQLDVGEPTLWRFLKTRPPRPNFTEVVMTEPVAVAAARVVRFGGVVVEGLSVAEIAELVKRLTCSA